METKMHNPPSDKHPGYIDIIINDKLENIGLEELKNYKTLTVKEAISLKTGLTQKEIEKSSGDQRAKILPIK